MARVIEVNDRTIGDFAVHEMIREGGRVERHVQVPEEHKELLLDLTHTYMESLLNAAQLRSFLRTVARRHDLTDDDFTYRTNFFKLIGSSETKFNGKDVPVALLPEDATVYKVERNAFLDEPDIPEDVRLDCYGKASLWTNMRAGTFPSMASEMQSTADIFEEGVTFDNQLLSAAVDFQDRAKDFDADVKEIKRELEVALSPMVWSLTEDKLSNISIYWHSEDTDSSTDSRVSMAKSRKFLDWKAEKWLDKQDDIDPDSVKKPMPKATVLRKEYPDIYKIGQTTSTKLRVVEL